jgi:hypothetical protein
MKKSSSTGVAVDVTSHELNELSNSDLKIMKKELETMKAGSCLVYIMFVCISFFILGSQCFQRIGDIYFPVKKEELINAVSQKIKQ